MARIKLSVVLDSGARFGPGKAALLESIRDTGSISAAARGMGMSYKRAWMLLDSIDRAFEAPAVEAATGGHGGGGARLTPFGRDLLDRYRRMEARVMAEFASDLAALEAAARPTPGPKRRFSEPPQVEVVWPLGLSYENRRELVRVAGTRRSDGCSRGPPPAPSPGKGRQQAEC
jgi:molybdate transport system regulatory protein